MQGNIGCFIFFCFLVLVIILEHFCDDWNMFIVEGHRAQKFEKQTIAFL